ncbi:MAG: hemin uptake protein HemP [Burkholderiales bacterium]|nr:hemin uptake protein HemP [Burkholderiales bacterium]
MNSPARKRIGARLTMPQIAATDDAEIASVSDGAHRADASGGASAGGAPPRVALAALIGAHRELHIAHGEETYWLRLTRANRLILTKLPRDD